jgi:hypothetical protein
MLLYSYKGKEPAPLPNRIRMKDGSTKTSLNKLSKKELESIGFFGPILKPEYDKDTQRLYWNGNEYEISDLTKEELSMKIENINYINFWEKFIKTNFFQKLRRESLESSFKNIIYTELISIFCEARFGTPNIKEIQKYIDILFFVYEFTEEEIEDLKKNLKETNLSFQYEIPSQEYILSNTYNVSLNKIIPISPFPSWIFINDKWEAPIPYPNDGKIYKWKEEYKSWIEL